MNRSFSTTIEGEFFPLELIEQVWTKGEINTRFKFFRYDCCGATMKRGDYGLRTIFGWHIDHIVPVSQGGTDDLSNLQPLHWENNVNKGENFPKWKCKVKF